MNLRRKRHTQYPPASNRMSKSVSGSAIHMRSCHHVGVVIRRRRTLLPGSVADGAWSINNILGESLQQVDVGACARNVQENYCRLFSLHVPSAFLRHAYQVCTCHTSLWTLFFVVCVRSYSYVAHAILPSCVSHTCRHRPQFLEKKTSFQRRQLHSRPRLPRTEMVCEVKSPWCSPSSLTALH